MGRVAAIGKGERGGRRGRRGWQRRVQRAGVEMGEGEIFFAPVPRSLFAFSKRGERDVFWGERRERERKNAQKRQDRSVFLSCLVLLWRGRESEERGGLLRGGVAPSLPAPPPRR
jgi:hypothetical protein